MSKKLYEESSIQDIATAIREQNSTIQFFARKGVDESDTVQFSSIFGNAADYSYTADSSGYANSVTAVGLDTTTISLEQV